MGRQDACKSTTTRDYIRWSARQTTLQGRHRSDTLQMTDTSTRAALPGPIPRIRMRVGRARVHNNRGHVLEIVARHKDQLVAASAQQLRWASRTYTHSITPYEQTGTYMFTYDTTYLPPHVSRMALAWSSCMVCPVSTQHSSFSISFVSGLISIS